ncbi:RluA family pseudouridine synthase [Shewanella aestuarii]|uniref:Dual-specificity RNA pseudouridine synthase RluA n=1 Tax=Shewanella aestuarii TaxID=1028752 RepID=A0A6G9QKE7_9GAMM|nr:pseudouridine synthase [Shewanella aestuarii]QIR15044.1 RNA pseudouridine synthase [Shewanella aestuarii]
MLVFTYRPPSIPWLDIRYIDRDIIVINKPSGLLSNPGIAPDTHDCAISRVLQRYKDAILVHRLDCDTSGIVIFARNKKAESHLKTQFQNRQAKKMYIAEVSGLLQPLTGQIDLPLGPEKDNPPFQQVTAEGKAAITDYRVLEHRTNSTLVELRPQTGRTHQLRVHMLALGHAILGDEFYADEQAKAASSRLKLHAQSLTIIHPFSQKQLTFTSRTQF